MDMFVRDHQAAIEWARDLLACDDWVVLDTETTGLGDDAQVCQIAVVASDGSVLFDSLVRPSVPIEFGARMVHGICDDDVQGAPTMADVAGELFAILEGKQVVVYNADFDWRVLRQSMQANGLEMPQTVAWMCAMHWYSQWVGDWSDYWGNYRWQKLPSGDHSAVGDCRATLGVIREMAEEVSDEVNGDVSKV